MPFRTSKRNIHVLQVNATVLANVPNVDSYVDNMLIFTETWDAHMNSLRQVLDRLRSAQLTAKPSKCLIGYDSFDCLGHNIVDQEDKSKDALRPQTKCQMKSFLGLAGFYCRFIPSFTEGDVCGNRLTPGSSDGHQYSRTCDYLNVLKNI